MNSIVNQFQLHFKIHGGPILDINYFSSIIPRKGEMIIIGGVSYDVCQVRYFYDLKVVVIIISESSFWT
jgi:hypothetical protein